MYIKFYFNWCLFFSVILLYLCSDIDKNPKWKYLPEDCGSGSFSDRIIGGKEATLGQFPWIARLGYDINKNSSKIFYLCAGALINEWYILTAAHCLEKILGETLKLVRLGENFIEEEKDCDSEICAPPVQDFEVQLAVKYKHPLKELSNTEGDIALIKLSKRAIFNDFVQPICLPRGVVIDKIDSHLAPGQSVEAAGWGTITPLMNDLPNKLMYILIPVVSLEVCKKKYQVNNIDETHICVGMGNGTDTCVGDSGGPLMKAISLGKSPKYFLVGIVSYGVKFCGSSAAVYTNVTHYMNWILENIEAST